MPSVRHHKTNKRRNRVLCVGIITIPHSFKVKWGQSHIMKAYVDWFEERNVDVIPIPYNTSEPELYFNMINGLVIPGGETDFIFKNKAFIKTAKVFFELSLNSKEYFPIWGTCFGYELLIALISGNTRFKKYPAQELAPIRITEDGLLSRMFSSFSSEYLTYLETQPSTAQNHDFGISPKDFMESKYLQEFYDIIATAVDSNGKEYVAAIEGKYYPIYGVQWHPERQETGGPFVDFFISEMRKNNHKCGDRRGQFLRTAAKKCVQYPEHKKLLCYFF